MDLCGFGWFPGLTCPFIQISNHVQSVDMGLLNHMAGRYGAGCGHARYIVKKRYITTTNVDRFLTLLNTP
jgi:hypothetical protein